MSAIKARNTLSRHWEMLKLLPTRDPGCSALQLCHLLKDAGFDGLVDVINKITDLSNLGIKVFISAGNEADDVYYDRIR